MIEENCAEDGYIISDAVGGGIVIRNGGGVNASFFSGLSCNVIRKDAVMSSKICCRREDFYNVPLTIGSLYVPVSCLFFNS